MSGRSYKIEHVDLAKESFRYSALSAAPYYFVFWYNDIPLGEKYYCGISGVTEEKFWENCLESIYPALEYYYLSKHADFQIQQVTNPSRGTIRQVCDSIFAESVSAPPASDLSVIICTKDRATDLDVCLMHLKDQTCKPLEIIVVDNGSSTNATENVCQKYNVHYVREDRIGLDIARNTGVRVAQGSIVAYTDDDTLPHSHWIDEISKTFLNPTVDAMTGLVIAASLETEAEVIFEKYWPFNRGYVPKKYDRNFFNTHLENGPPVWEIGAGANMAFRKKVFQEAGYFDERLDAGAAGCNGDSEMWYRLLASGKIIEYNPRAVVEHKHRTSIESLKKQLHAYMRGFTVAILIQYSNFGHAGNLRHLFKVVPVYYLSLIRKGFPYYNHQYRTLFSELTGVVSGLFYFLRNRRIKI
jgi:glycosyltransferase involved in cell wall biosynthesis